MASKSKFWQVEKRVKRKKGPISIRNQKSRESTGTLIILTACSGKLHIISPKAVPAQKRVASWQMRCSGKLHSMADMEGMGLKNIADRVVTVASCTLVSFGMGKAVLPGRVTRFLKIR